MGTITAVIDPTNSLTIQTVKGQTSAAQIADAIAKYYEGESTLHILWDFSEADLSEISPQDVANLVALTKRFSSRRPGGKTALLFSSDFGFGMGRMYDIQHDVSGGEVMHMSFRGKDAAMSWLLG
ncbi:MAG: hypothetical protein AB1428_04065 [Bacteroidota bacterium]